MCAFGSFYRKIENTYLASTYGKNSKTKEIHIKQRSKKKYFKLMEEKKTPGEKKKLHTIRQIYWPEAKSRLQSQ